MEVRKSGWRSAIAVVAALAALPAGSALGADRAGTWETRLDIIYQNSADWDFSAWAIT
jgi:hypothetical protein